jgi:hypothetical protein
MVYISKKWHRADANSSTSFSPNIPYKDKLSMDTYVIYNSLTNNRFARSVKNDGIGFLASILAIKDVTLAAMGGYLHGWQGAQTGLEIGLATDIAMGILYGYKTWESSRSRKSSR